MELVNISQPCRLCLKIPNSGCQVLDECIQDDLNSLLLYLDLAISDEPIVCNACATNLKQCVKFRTKCLLSLDHINSIACSRSFKVDPSDICKSEANDFDDYNSCRLCLEQVKSDPPEFLGSDHVEMIRIYFPELGLIDIDNAQFLTCISCYKLLQRYFGFIKSLLHIEEKLVEYRKAEGARYKGLIDLNSAAALLAKNTLQDISEVYPGPSLVKTEETYIEKVENLNSDIVKSENLIEIGEEMIVKLEDVTEPKVESIEWDSHQDDMVSAESTYKCTHCAFVSEDEDSLRQHVAKHENSGYTNSKYALHKCTLCAFQTKHKYYLRQHTLIHKDPNEVRMFKCTLCPYQTKYGSNLRQHGLVHKTTDEVTMYKCTLCSYQTKFKTSIPKHMVVHGKTNEPTTYSCTFCTFETKIKHNFERHMPIHERPPTMHKCTICSYQTRFKSNLQDHVLTHKSSDEVTMFKCAECGFETKFKSSLRKHVALHQNSSNTLTCTLCTFTTKLTYYLHKHTLRCHPNGEKIEMPNKPDVCSKIVRSGLIFYKCNACDFESTHHNSVRRHSVIHKDVSEVTTYKCTICPFLTRRKFNLSQHLLTHKSSSEISMHKCTECSFETKYHYSLLKHAKIHNRKTGAFTHKCRRCVCPTKQENCLREQDLQETRHESPAESQTASTKTPRSGAHKCTECSFATDCKSNLRKHAIVHKNIMHKCTECDFATKYKPNLHKHMVIHKSGPEAVLLKCERCSFETKHKKSFKRHVALHSSSKEILHKCTLCEFETKHKNNIGRHMIVHKSIAEVKVYICDVCTFKTKHRSSHRKHMMAHKDLGKEGEQTQGMKSEAQDADDVTGADDVVQD